MIGKDIPTNIAKLPELPRFTECTVFGTSDIGHCVADSRK